MDPGNDHFPMALPNGFRMDHYQIQRTLGVGSFGVTYLALSHRFNEHCVIKELLPGDFATRSSATQEIVPLSQQMEKGFKYCQHDFLREATILHKINHPNVVKILDRFDRNGTSYYVMPYAKGITLEQFMEQLGPGRLMAEKDLLELLFPLLDGLECVHGQGYLHRDIKPENIIIRETGEPLMIDFGAARQLIASRSRPMSAILTRGYAPYEQYGSTQNQGPYTDIYAMGAVLHRVITGQPPPESVDRLGPGADPYQPLGARRDLPAYSEKLRRAIDVALIPHAKQRPQSIVEWRQHLPSSAAPCQPPQTSAPPGPPPLPTHNTPPPYAPPAQPHPEQSYLSHDPLPPHFFLHGTVRPAQEEQVLPGSWQSTGVEGRHTTQVSPVLRLVVLALAAMLLLWAALYFLLSLLAG